MAGILSFGLGQEHFLASVPILMGLFIAATATDWLDGYLARKWKVVSGFGRMIDPIADKLLVAGCLIALCIVAEGSWLFLVPAVAIIFPGYSRVRRARTCGADGPRHAADEACEMEDRV